MKLILILISLFLPFFSYATTQILIIGDSITTTGGYLTQEQVYTSLVEKDLLDNHFDVKVMSFGVSSMVTGGAIDCLNNLYRNFYPHAFNPEIIVVAIGINDLGVYLNHAEGYHEQLIKICLERAAIPVWGIIDASALYPIFPIENLYKFNQIYINLIMKYGLHTFKFLNPILMNDPSCHIGDRIHPTAKGHRIICNELKPVLMSLLKSR